MNILDTHAEALCAAASNETFMEALRELCGVDECVFTDDRIHMAAFRDGRRSVFLDLKRAAEAYAEKQKQQRK